MKYYLTGNDIWRFVEIIIIMGFEKLDLARVKKKNTMNFNLKFYLYSIDRFFHFRRFIQVLFIMNPLMIYCVSRYYKLLFPKFGFEPISAHLLAIRSPLDNNNVAKKRFQARKAGCKRRDTEKRDGRLFRSCDKTGKLLEETRRSLYDKSEAKRS